MENTDVDLGTEHTGMDADTQYMIRRPIPIIGSESRYNRLRETVQTMINNANDHIDDPQNIPAIIQLGDFLDLLIEGLKPDNNPIELKMTVNVPRNWRNRLSSYYSTMANKIKRTLNIGDNPTENQPTDYFSQDDIDTMNSFGNDMQRFSDHMFALKHSYIVLKPVTGIQGDYKFCVIIPPQHAFGYDNRVYLDAFKIESFLRELKMYIHDTAELQYDIDRDPARFHPGGKTKKRRKTKKKSLRKKRKTNKRKWSLKYKRSSKMVNKTRRKK